MKKTIELKVTAHDLRSIFGNIVDYVITEVAGILPGWTHYDVISYNRDAWGCQTWEIDLEDREDEDNPVTIANVHIKFGGMDDDTQDDEVVADATIEINN